VLLKNYHWDLSGSISVSKPILGPRTFILSLMTTARETKNHRSWTKAKDNIPDLCEHAIKTKKLTAIEFLIIWPMLYFHCRSRQPWLRCISVKTRTLYW